MAGDEIFDSIRLRHGPDFTQWPKLSCSEASQLAIEAKTLQVTGAIKATSFQGDGSTLDGVVKKVGDTITGALTIQNTLSITGNVGIGSTDAAAAKLHIYSPDDNALKITNTALSKTARIGVDRLGVWIEPSETDSSIRLNANPNLVGLHVNGTNGNVGIGTTSPRNPLGIRATGVSEELMSFEDSSGKTKWHINQNLGGTQPGFNIVETGVADGRLFIQVGGNVGIGTTSPSFGLDVRGSTGWIGSGDSSQSLGGWRLGRWSDYGPNEWVYLSRADRTAYQDFAVGALWAGGTLRFGTADDVAEMTPVKADDELEPGDVVVIDEPPDHRVLLKRSYQPYDSRVAGVVSDAKTAGLIIGGSHPTEVDRKDLKPLALVGRVLTKVTAENGSIQVGDLLVTASKPGYAMRATKPGYTLGKALQSFNGDRNREAVGKIWVLIHLGWFGIS